MIKAVIFDLDGVVTDTAKYHNKAWKKIADEFQIDFDEKFNEKFKGVGRKECLEMLLKKGNKEITALEKEETLKRKNDYYLEYLKEISNSNILPGIIEALKYLKENGIKTALFSVSKNTDFILERIGLSNTFDVKVTGNDITKSKPDPEGYLLAVKRLMVKVTECMMIEDSDVGISGAKNVDMATIKINNDTQDLKSNLEKYIKR